MKYFYFHLRTANEVVIDQEGSAFADYSSAEREGEKCVRELLANEIRSPKGELPDALVIADEAGLEVPFRLERC